MRLLERVPALTLAKATVTGIGIPGVEGAISGVLALATMISTMHSNKDALSKIDKCLETLISIDPSSCGEHLKNRLSILISKLTLISVDCKALTQKHRFKRFVMGKEYKEQIQDVKDSIASCIQDFTFHGNISIEKSVTVMAAQVNRVLAKGILDNIGCIPARYNSENSPDACMEGTRIDVVNEIVTRLTSSIAQPTQRVVMLSGPAGSGKSTIAKTVASTLARDKQILAASFFFSRDYTERKDIRFVPATIARQLADHNIAFERLLVKFLDNDRTGILSAEPRMQFQTLVVDILAQMPPSATPWVICLDALDECGQDRGQVFLRWLSDSIAHIPAHVQFFLTGRPDVPSYLKLDKLHPLMHNIILDEVDPITVERDIRLYVEQSLDGNRWTTRESWKVRDTDVDEITRRASGLFVFAATAVRYILAGLPQDHPQSSVDYLLKGAALTDLEDLYHHIVNEAISWPAPSDQRAQDSRDRVMRILGTILQLFEPLDPDSLAELLHMDVDVIKRTLSPLSAVIRVPDVAGRTIQIIHLSFREFMTSGILHRRSDLVCGTEDQQCFVASNLIRIMQTQLKFNICDLPTSYLPNIDMPKLQWRLATYIPGYLRYSCRYWADHLTGTLFNSDIAQEASKFLFDKFLFWLEVLSLLGMVGYGPMALSKFIVWTKDKFSVRFASDAKRFIAFFAPAIVRSAPHIYLSALALAPKESEITTRFHSQFPRLLAVKKGLVTKWPAIISVLEGHTNAVNSIACSPDGRHILSGSSDNTLRIWDAESGEELGQPLEGHTGWVNSVAFSADGKYCVSGSNDGTIRIWDVDSKEQVGQPLEGHTACVNSVSFSYGGKRLVSGSDDKTIRIWDTESGKQLGQPLKGHTDWVRSVAFSKNGENIVSGSDDGTIRIWDAQSGKETRQPLKGHTGYVLSVAFSPDGKHIVSGTTGESVCIWDAESGEILGESLAGHTGYVLSAVFSPDGKHLAVASGKKIICVWDALQSGEERCQSLEGHTSWVNSVAFLPNGNHLVSGSDDGTIRIWDAQSGEELCQSLEGHISWVNSVEFSQDGKHIVSRYDDGFIRIWDAESGEEVGEPSNSHTNWINSFASSLDGKHMVSGCTDHTLRIWDTESGEQLCEPLEGHTDWVRSVQFSADGRYIVSGSWDHSLRIWDAKSGVKLGQPLEGHSGYVNSVGFSSDGKYIVSGSSDKTIRVWDAISGEVVGQPLEGHTASVNSVAFSSDMKHIVSGSDDKTIRIWDAVHCTCKSDPESENEDQLSKICISKPNSISASTVPFHSRIHQGWMSYKSDLLFWIPSVYRTGVWMPLNTLVIGRKQIKFSYTNFKHGTEWAQCYSPPSGGRDIM
ncbi:WD40-repeat-containing domain protein [Mycena capillaripes]|nr:WD40-repeat-containing domain protein [Mycena capillaripes]